MASQDRAQALDLETQVDDPDAGDGRGTANHGDIEVYALSLGPATTADLLELDAVPEPTDSDAPQSTFGTPADPKAITQKNRRTERP
ncbi:MAG TPA: hypothetical protein VFD36_23060 [Kofleriaceae bacterium]|nr:hypothetical protein [Kofleriaceae bacterium]